MSGLDLNFAVVGIVNVNNVGPAEHLHVLPRMCDAQTVKWQWVLFHVFKFPLATSEDDNC
jgi:hypothetical protein